MKIKFTDTSAFIITGRNNDNSSFYIRPKADYLREKEIEMLVISFATEGMYTEKDIIEMIKNGTLFYTINEDEFTLVKVVDGNLKSYANKTKVDNIESLPIYGLDVNS